MQADFFLYVYVLQTIFMMIIQTPIYVYHVKTNALHALMYHNVKNVLDK